MQVLNEVANAARRKMRLSWPETRDLLATLRALLTVHPVTVEVHETGLAVAERCGLSVWDGRIAASALEASCGTLLSEDLQDGMLVDGCVRVVNPSRA